MINSDKKIKGENNMVQEQYTTKRRKGQHLKLIERGKIEALLKIGMSKVKIAEELGISVRTLHREIKRDMVELLNTDLSTREVYSAEFAQLKYDKAQKGKEGELKIGKNLKLVKYLEDSMKRGKDSPYAALEQAKREGLGVGYFYAYSFSSWERGSNENNNKLIRRFIAKGTDITDITEEELKSIEKWMNNYPRKLFNGKSSKEMYDIELKQYIS